MIYQFEFCPSFKIKQLLYWAFKVWSVFNPSPTKSYLNVPHSLDDSYLLSGCDVSKTQLLYTHTALFYVLNSSPKVEHSIVLFQCMIELQSQFLRDYLCSLVNQQGIYKERTWILTKDKRVWSTLKLFPLDRKIEKLINSK